jgi:hypothetical protein
VGVHLAAESFEIEGLLGLGLLRLVGHMIQYNAGVCCRLH